MPSYLGSTDYNHATPERIGVLLVNLGTPDAPDTASVRRYLQEFLSDPRVIETPRWLWWLILNGVILRIRPARSAHAYQQVWTPEGSPLLTHTQALARELHESLRSHLHTDVQVEVGMSYGNPSLNSALEKLRTAQVRKLIVLPLYPQYSGSTTGSVFDAVSRQLQRWRWVPICNSSRSITMMQRISRHWRIQCANTGKHRASNICCCRFMVCQKAT